MQVPDDVTLLLCDDNWGNLRKLPALDAKPRKGGYGIYYHFDYVGGPRSYKWINTYQIERTWEQMHLAYEHGVNQIWIVNVGDIKPLEFPIEFFLDYAWNPDKIYPGGQTFTVSAAPYQIPLFVRVGSSINLGNLNQEWQESVTIAQKNPDLKTLEAGVNDWFVKNRGQ